MSRQLALLFRARAEAERREAMAEYAKDIEHARVQVKYILDNFDGESISHLCEWLEKELKELTNHIDDAEGEADSAIEERDNRIAELEAELAEATQGD